MKSRISNPRFKISSLSAAAALATIAFAFAVPARAAVDAKNVAPVYFESLPSDLGAYLRAHPERWDFGFRPYDASASDLWTDPQLQRNATEGRDTGGARPTAITFAMDARGLTMLLFCGEPSITNCFAAGEDYPSSRTEFFICPGDADLSGVRHHYHMYYNGRILQEYPWLVAARDFRPLLPYTTFEEQELPNGTVQRLTYAWEGMFDYLPCVDEPEKDNFWRFSAIRWSKGGGQTWGGKVHAPSSAGYIRFPAFTDAQRAAILTHVLHVGWKRYRGFDESFNYRLGNGLPYAAVNTNLYHRQEHAAAPRSYVNYAEDPGFRPTLAALRAKREALGPELARFAAMAPGEQVAFYRRAAPLLFNFREDVEEAYRLYQERRLREPFGEPPPADYVCGEGDVPLAKPLGSRNAPDLGKLRAELDGLDAKVAAAASPDVRARLLFRQAQLRFVLAVDDQPEAHLTAMQAAATARDVSPDAMLDLLREFAQFRRDKWRRYNDTFDFERDAWKALEDAGALTNAAARRLYYRNALKLAGSHFGGSWRSDTWNLLDEYSQERMLALAERALDDAVASDGAYAAAGAFRSEMAGKKWNALVAMDCDADAEKFLLDCLAATNRFDVRGTRAKLVEFYRAIAKRYETDPDPATLEKAFAYADSNATKADIALAMKDYKRALEFAATDLQRADAAFGLGDYATAAEEYAKVQRPGEGVLLRHAKALYALGRYAEALPLVEAYHAKARGKDKTAAALYIKRLKALAPDSESEAQK